MSSTYSYTVSPASLHGHVDDSTNPEFHHHDPVDAGYDPGIASSQLLSPHSTYTQSTSASPADHLNTPAESISSTISAYPSEFASDAGDPFFGVDFNDLESGVPSFLDDHIPHLPGTQQSSTQASTSEPFYVQSNPPSPPERSSIETSASAPQLTPDTTKESWSSDDSLGAFAMTSPMVMVSVWKDGEEPIHTIERSFTPVTEGSRSLRVSNDDCLSINTLHGSLPSVSRDTRGTWVADSATGQRGLSPEQRSYGETESINQLAAARKVDRKNLDVETWVSETAQQTTDPSMGQPQDLSTAEDDGIPDKEIPLGDETVNKHVPGQVYYNTEFVDQMASSSPGKGFSPADLEMMPSRNWGDAPMMHPIDSQRAQPESSQAAIRRFERMCQDNESVVSHAATWGTRRRSLPSLVDTEGVISGSLFKKLTIRADSSQRRPSILKKIPALVRRPSASQILKRKGSNGDDSTSDESPSNIRRDSLAPPSRTPSWSIRQRPTPSLNTAIVGMATGAASIGASHARSGSISATSMASPKSPFHAFPPVKNPLRRPRSKTEVPKADSPYPHIVGMLKQAGGPPVAVLAKSHPALDHDDDDDDDDDADDADMKVETSKGEEIIPTLEGFQQHILRLNPTLASTNGYLVERIAHQMVARYKTLQNQKIKHLKQARAEGCSSGTFCSEGHATVLPLDSKGGARGLDPLLARGDSDGDMTPLEGGINVESFPLGIPMPPTTVLPAEFECQICFVSRKFIKPSDWTKHVHEDVQPFTCTWDRCRDPKMFKRKADWVRHENEGHRHLEWWTCDVEDCRHVCYRRDNFLQHLVREHKFAEPRVKTKAAIKKAGGSDPTWQRVEKCHVETSNRPQDEPCRFCGKTFPSWKKLTVHLAKHMEHLSLPVLKLVDARVLDQDTIISPIQDLPPRNFNSQPTPVKQEQPAVVFPQPRPHAFSNPSPMGYSSQDAFGGFQQVAHNQMQQYYGQTQANNQFDGVGQSPAGGLMMPQVTTGFAPQQFPAMPMSSGPTYGHDATNAYMPLQNQLEPFPPFNNPLGLQDPSGGQMPYDAMTNPTMANVEQYSNHGSVSPYSRSPQPPNTGFYTQ